MATTNYFCTNEPFSMFFENVPLGMSSNGNSIALIGDKNNIIFALIINHKDFIVKDNEFIFVTN